MAAQRSNSVLVFVAVLVAAVVIVYAVVSRKPSTPAEQGLEQAPAQPNGERAEPAAAGPGTGPTDDGVTHIDQTTDTTNAPTRDESEAGAPPEWQAIGGASPPATLIEAAHVGDMDALTAMIGAGVDLDAIDEGGRTALMAAAGAGKVEAVFALLNAGADLSRRDNARRGARDYALARYDEAGQTIARILGEAAGPPPVQDPGEK